MASSQHMKGRFTFDYIMPGDYNLWYKLLSKQDHDPIKVSFLEDYQGYKYRNREDSLSSKKPENYKIFNMQRKRIKLI